MALKFLFSSQSIALAKGQQRPLEGEGSRGQKVKEWTGVGVEECRPHLEVCRKPGMPFQEE